MSKRSTKTGKLRLCNVGFLNGAPYRAARSLDFVEYSESDPAECARRLHEDECDMSCIPLAEVFQHGGYAILDYGIAAEGPVESVLLVSREPPESLKTILIDDTSHSALAFLRILWRDAIAHKAQEPAFHRLPRKRLLERIQGSVGGLVIGDEALRLGHRYPYALDLAELWRDHTGLPAVFAVWAGREALNGEKGERLRAAFKYGIENRLVFAREWADEHNFDRDSAQRYVGQTVQYELSEGILSGAREFHRRGFERGIFPKKFPEVLTGSHSRPLSPRPIRPSQIHLLLERSSLGERLALQEAKLLAEHASLADLGLAANLRRQMFHPESAVSYIVERNINYTNVCNVYCRFCAFYRAPGKHDGYVLTKEEIGRKIEETIAAGGIQILLQGGLNPELGIEYYEDLFSWLRSNYPVNLHALSADEIAHIANVSRLSYEQVFERLIAAGLGSLPGAGAEILVDRVRQRIARLKTTASEWLAIHRTAHQMGLRSTCTMMFGVQETWDDRILHLHKLRQLQDETGGFTAFICWPFQEKNTKLKGGDTSPAEYLRVQAIARLFLDNIPNIQSSWVTMGGSVGQIALLFGANDFGSVMFEENVVSAAGTTFQMDSASIERHISSAGFLPWRRNHLYQPVANVVPLYRRGTTEPALE